MQTNKNQMARTLFGNSRRKPPVVGIAGRVLAAANDDGVASAAVATAIVAPYAANDDAVGHRPPPGSHAGVPANDVAGPVPPAPGSATIPALWSQDDPHVVALLAYLRHARDAARKPTEHRVVDLLFERAMTTGELPMVDGRLSIAGLAAAARVSEWPLTPGSRARKVLDRVVRAFRLEKVETRQSPRFSSVPRTSLIAAMKDVVSSYVADGRAVETTAGKVSWEALAIAANVDRVKLIGSPTAKAVVRDALADGRLSLGGPFVPPPRISREEQDARIAELMAVVAGFDVPGGTVPESPLRRGLVDWARIAALTGREGDTMERVPRYRSAVLEVARRRGMAPAGLTMGDDTLAALREDGLHRVEVAQVARGSTSASAVVANHRSVLDRLMREMGATTEDGGEAVFASEVYEPLMDRIMAGFGNARSGSNFRRIADWWRDLRDARVGASGLPAEFGAALDLLVRRHDWSLVRLAEAVGCVPGLLTEWIAGQRGVSSAQVPVVGCLEAQFGQAAGSLLIKIGPMPRSAGPGPSASEWFRKVPSKLRKLLPPEAMHWPEPRLEAALAQVRPLAGGGTAYGRLSALSRTPEYRLPPFKPSPRLAAQIAGYVAYKTAAVPYPLQRPPNARWKSETSVQMRRDELEMVFRYLTAPVADGWTSGLGIDAAHGTLAWLAHAPVGFTYVGNRVSRFADLDDGDGPRGIRYGSMERAVVQHLVSLTNPATGYLAQTPALAHTLAPIDTEATRSAEHLLSMFGMSAAGSLLSAEDVAFAQRDWVGFVSRAHLAYVQALAYVDDVMEVSRVAIEPVRGLVEAEEPQAELMWLLLEAARRRSDERIHPSSYRCDIRDEVMNRIAAATAFRPANLANLTYRGDQTGKLRRVDGTWMLEVGYREFKNYRSSRLFGVRGARKDFRMELRDEGGMHELLELYVGDVLPALAIDDGLDPLFRSYTGSPMSTDAWNRICHRFGMRHVAHNPVLGTGMPGVISMNPYCFRHIKASDTLRNGLSTNRLEEAAFALQTGEAMVQYHYGFLLPEQATRTSLDTFARAVQIAQRRGR